MGKAAKAHRAKVAKRNANFQEQIEKMKEQFAAMSGDTMS